MRASALFYCSSEMKNQGDLVNTITEVAEEVGRREGIEIVELQLLGGGRARVLRIYIDKPGGVTHADCERMSHEVGAILDAQEIIPGESYTLEVSSPGVERKLSKRSDFERFSGQRAKISLTEPVENQRHWEGTLRGLEGDSIQIEPAEGRMIQIPLQQVRKANLKFEW